jgi:hypothetical protein
MPWGARVGDLGPVVGKRVELAVVVERAVDERDQLVDLRLGEVKPERLGCRVQLIGSG